MLRKRSECRRTREMLSPYIDGELSAADIGRVERHIAGCAACRAELDSLRLTVGLLRQEGMVEPPRSFAIAHPVPQRRYVPSPAYAALRAASAVAVALLAFVFIADASGAFGGYGGAMLNWDMQHRASPCSSGADPGLNESDVSSVDYLSANESAEGFYVATGSPDEVDSEWPVMQIEIGLSVTTLALALAAVLLRRVGATAGVRADRGDESWRRKGG